MLFIFGSQLTNSCKASDYWYWHTTEGRFEFNLQFVDWSGLSGNSRNRENTLWAPLFNFFTGQILFKIRLPGYEPPLVPRSRVVLWFAKIYPPGYTRGNSTLRFSKTRKKHASLHHSTDIKLSDRPKHHISSSATIPLSMLKPPTYCPLWIRCALRCCEYALEPAIKKLLTKPVIREP